LVLDWDQDGSVLGTVEFTERFIGYELKIITKVLSTKP
jgi:hypothetical protein